MAAAGRLVRIDVPLGCLSWERARSRRLLRDLALVVTAAWGALGAMSPAIPAPDRPTAVVAGTLRSAADGSALRGATVGFCVWRDSDAEREAIAEGRLVPEALAEVSTDGEGRFSLSVSSKEPIYLIARAPRHARSGISMPIIPSGVVDLGVIELPESRDLAGALYGPDGGPLKGARVLAIPATGGLSARHFQPWPLAHEATTAEDGSFLLDGIGKPGVYIGVLAPGMALEPAESEKTPGGLRVRAQRAATIVGRVVTPGGESPVPGAWVTSGRGVVSVTRAGEAGMFELKGAAPGKTNLVASAPARAAGASGYFAPSAAVDVAGDTSEPQTLRLRSGGRLKVHVTDDETGKPIAAARLLGAMLSEQFVLTNADGSATVSGLLPREGRLWFQADEYADSGMADVHIRTGEDFTLDVRLKRTSSLEGRVVDSTGSPVNGAHLRAGTLYERSFIDGASVKDQIEIGEVASGPDGAFRLAGLPPGARIRVEAVLTGYATGRLETAALAPGERRTGAEIVLEKGLTIGGRVVDVEGRPVAGARVLAQSSRDSEYALRMRFDRHLGELGERNRAGDSFLAGAVTDADGRFSLADAGKGAWSIGIRADGYTLKLVRSVTVDAPDGGDAGEITLDRGSRIRGRVADAQGNPVEKPLIFINAESQISVESWGATVKEDGTFESDDLPPGREVTLSLKVDGYLPVKKTGLVPPIEDLVLTVSKGRQLSGRVVDAESETPVTDCYIQFGHPSREGSGEESPAQDGSEFCDEDSGRFTIESVRPGPVYLKVEAGGYRPATVSDLTIPEQGPVHEVIVRLSRALVLTGTVIDEQRKPIEGVEVEIEPMASAGLSLGTLFSMEMTGPSDRTDSVGSFELPLDRADPVRLSFRKDGYEPREIEVKPAAKQEELRVTLSRGGTLTGVVKQESDGLPVAGATVSAIRQDGGMQGNSAASISEQNGSFLIAGLSPGTYRVAVKATGMVPNELEGIVVSRGAPTEPITLLLRSGVRLNGWLKGLPRERLESIEVTVLGAKDAIRTRGVDSSGRFVIEGVPSGRVGLVFKETGSSDARTVRVVDIPAGIESWDVTIDLGEAITVRGVVSRGGAPVMGVTLMFTSTASDSQLAATSKTDGSYTLQGLLPGTYNVTAISEPMRILNVREVTIEGDRQLDVELPAERIAGVITAAASGEPISSADIAVDQLDPDVRLEARLAQVLSATVSDDAGRYTIEGISPGRYRLTVRAKGFAFESREVTVQPGVTASASIALAESSSSVTIRIASEGTGAPASGQFFLLVLLPGGGDPLGPHGSGDYAVFQGMITPDGSGRATIESLRPGRYRALLWTPQLAPEMIDLTAPSESTTVSLACGTPVSLRADGVPAGADSRFVLLDAAARPVYLQPFLPDPVLPIKKGSELTVMLRPGQYTVRLAMPDGRVIQKPFAVTDGHPVELTLP